jgi:hypothetical protein
MKNRNRILTGVLCALLLVVITILISGGIRRSEAQEGIRRTEAQEKAGDDHAAIRDALRRGGLREAAKLKGHYIEDFDPHWDFGLFDIESLTKNSAAIVVGIPTKNLGGRLSSSGQAILTNYEVLVQETFKGTLTAGQTITVSLPGGRVEFDDGTSAELRTPDFEHVKTSGAYTFFLSETKNPDDGYTLTAGPQGLVELVDGTVRSHGRSSDPVAKEIKGRDKDSFLKEVREKAQKWPNKGKCCS